MSTSTQFLLIRNTRSYHPLPLSTQLTRFRSPSWTENRPRKSQHANRAHQKGASISRRDGNGASSRATNCFHGRGNITRGYTQLGNNFNQLHRGRSVKSPPIKLHSVYTKQVPSRRQLTIFKIQPKPYSPPSKKFSSSPILTECCIHRTKT